MLPRLILGSGLSIIRALQIICSRKKRGESVHRRKNAVLLFRSLLLRHGKDGHSLDGVESLAGLA